MTIEFELGRRGAINGIQEGWIVGNPDSVLGCCLVSAICVMVNTTVENLFDNHRFKIQIRSVRVFNWNRVSEVANLVLDKDLDMLKTLEQQVEGGYDSPLRCSRIGDCVLRLVLRSEEQPNLFEMVSDGYHLQNVIISLMDQNGGSRALPWICHQFRDVFYKNCNHPNSCVCNQVSKKVTEMVTLWAERGSLIVQPRRHFRDSSYNMCIDAAWEVPERSLSSNLLKNWFRWKQLWSCENEQDCPLCKEIGADLFFKVTDQDQVSSVHALGLLGEISKLQAKQDALINEWQGSEGSNKKRRLN